MLHKIIDISENAAFLRARHEQLLIESNGREQSVPLEEVAVLIVAQPAVCFTQAVLNGLCAHGGAFIICDERKMPSGMLLPFAGHFIQTERFAAQLKAGLPLKKRLWSQIVKAKILAQARLLKALYKDDWGLTAMARKVRTGDPANFESWAARRYWAAMFGDNFSRRPRSDDNINCLLNYGYGVMRSLVARALCGSGLHPSIGIHHHNRYDPFCLADDIMEPLRPLVDDIVSDLLNFLGRDVPLDKAAKSFLLSEFQNRKLILSKEKRSIFDSLARTAACLSDIFQGKRQKLIFPYSQYGEKTST